MSYDIDEEGNKVFNETIEGEAELQEYVVFFGGVVTVKAHSFEEAERIALDMDLSSDIEIKDVELI